MSLDPLDPSTLQQNTEDPESTSGEEYFCVQTAEPWSMLLEVTFRASHGPLKCC